GKVHVDVKCDSFCGEFISGKWNVAESDFGVTLRIHVVVLDATGGGHAHTVGLYKPRHASRHTQAAPGEIFLGKEYSMKQGADIRFVQCLCQPFAAARPLLYSS